MASSVQETGYEDELFQYPVGPSLHCCICTNVIKDPVMCDNEHIFCRACITTHLMYSPTCPTCMQPLTVETLRQATRGIRNLLSELQIRCEFFDRGCGKFVQLGDLERHVADCGFAPAVCSNEGCQLEVNKQDLLHHVTAVCELRIVKCHSCNDIRREMDTMKVDLEAMNVKLDRNEARLMATLQKLEKNEKAVENAVEKAVEKAVENAVEKAVENAVAQGIKQIQDIVERKKSDEKLDRNEKTLLKTLERIETNGKAVEKVAANIDLIQQTDQEEKTKQGEINENLNLITKQLKRIIQQTSSNVANQQNKTKEENFQKSPAIEKACKNDDVGYLNTDTSEKAAGDLISFGDDSPCFNLLQTKKNYIPRSSDSIPASTQAQKEKAVGDLTSSGDDDSPCFNLFQAKKNYIPRSSDSIPAKNSSTQAQKDKAAEDLTSSSDDSPRFNRLQAKKNYSLRSSDSIPAKNSSTQAQKEKAVGDLTFSGDDDSPRFNRLQAKKNYSPRSSDSIPAKNSSTQAQKDYSPRFSYSTAVKNNSRSVRDFIPAKEDSPCLKHSTLDKDDKPSKKIPWFKKRKPPEI